jgi:curved DNA-binding protein CbpA
MDGPTLYERLGVAPDASSHEIAAAYRAQARRYHPDVNAAPDAEALMVQVNDAFAVLGDPVRRRDYDLSLRAPVQVAAGSGYADPDPLPPPRRKRRLDLTGDVWGNNATPDFVRLEVRRQAGARELRAYWRENYDTSTAGGVLSTIGTMLVLPLFITIVVLLVRVVHLR